MLDWLIVGGGPHGVHLAIRILSTPGHRDDVLRIVDPAPRLLHRWRTLTSRTGMTHLRSPSVHHLGLDAWDLHRFAGHGPGRIGRRRRRSADDAPRSDARFQAPYDRPALDLFDAHGDHLIARHDLARRHVQARVTGLAPLPEDGPDGPGWRVRQDDGSETLARRVLLALGTADAPAWPHWAREAKRLGASVHHLLAPGAVDGPLPCDDRPRRVGVVGAGISGVQVALRLVDTGHTVSLWSRHPIREALFDSDPGWVGPKHMRGFSRLAEPQARRAAITEARHRGSIPRHLRPRLRRALETGHLVHHVHPDLTGTVVSRGPADPSGSSPPVRLHAGTHELVVDHLLLATGVAPGRPGGALVDGLVQQHALPTAPCGYPLVDTHLQWAPGLFVSGALAELELGPVARNLVGARRAAERLVRGLRGALRPPSEPAPTREASAARHVAA